MADRIAATGRGFHFIFRLSALWIVLSGTSHAQTAQNFEQLRLHVAAGDTLKIRAASTGEVRGKLIEISGAGILLSAGGSTRTFAEAQVREVWQQQKDPLSNGIWIGLAAGVACRLPGACGVLRRIQRSGVRSDRSPGLRSDRSGRRRIDRLDGRSRSEAIRSRLFKCPCRHTP